MDLRNVVTDIADGIKEIDSGSPPFKTFKRGAGPYGEPQLVKLVAHHLMRLDAYGSRVRTMRTPDLLIRGDWSIEIKIVRPFGDNGLLAENWSVNLLHPYVGNTSLLGDCLKLQNYACAESKAVIAIGYEHEPPQVELEPLLQSFELVARGVLSLKLGDRITERRTDLIHPVHQRVTVSGWQLN